MGHIEEPHLTTLIKKHSVQAAKEIRQQKADIALLVPAWGICNQTVGLVQREVEQQGISTVGISISRRVSESVNPPRTYYLKYPFGHAMGEVFNRKQQKQIFLDCLKILETATTPGKIIDSKYRWKKTKFE